MKILFLNGPPGCGKDTVANILINDIQIPRMLTGKFAAPIRTAAKHFFGFSTDEELEKAKRETPLIRKFMIGWSEDLIKPIFGKDWFAKRAANIIYGSSFSWNRWVISDAGFQYEVDDFIKTITELMSKRNESVEFELWNISRTGCNFKKDSRETVSITEGRVIEIKNNGTEEQLKSMVEVHSYNFFGVVN